MKFRSRIAVISATILSCMGLIVAGSTSASAAATSITFCNDNNSQFSYVAEFPQRGGLSTVIISPGNCLSYDFFSPGEPYITHVMAWDGRYRDTAGYSVWDCNERVTLFGSYEATNMEQKCV